MVLSSSGGILWAKRVSNREEKTQAITVVSVQMIILQAICPFQNL